ncbi:hypothetical protein AWV79_00255 [Cupriavidus sp. UYMMa02A]|nr:hypothetical protein AWV79_00255 [Cupriavidus sp. UYMMa02A]
MLLDIWMPDTDGVTAALAAAVLQQLPFADRADYEDASRGLVAPFNGEVRNPQGRVIWKSSTYDFQKAEKSPDSVNPSLWRMAQLNNTPACFACRTACTRCAASIWPT